MTNAVAYMIGDRGQGRKGKPGPLSLPRENGVPSRLTPFSSLTSFVVRESGARRGSL